MSSNAPVDLPVSLRDYFAAHAPEAPAWWWSDFTMHTMSSNAKRLARLAEWPHTWADAMLKAKEASDD